MIKKFTIFAAAIALAFTAGAATPTLLSRADRAASDRWVDSVYRTLDLSGRVAQLVVPKAGPGADYRARVKSFAEHGVGGILFAKGTLEEYASMTNYAQSLSRIPMLMTFDGEWGLNMRIASVPKFPANMTLGAISDPQLLYNYGKEMARQCREMGIQVNFAPDIDVNSNPKNPVIGFRSFGEDPARVAALGLAYAKGLEDNGVQAVGKHFPGHGDTDVDSHKAKVTVNHSLNTLNQIDLVPFKAMIDGGCSGVMVGHIAVPALDPSGRPASTSKPIITGLLREKLGFEGLIYTDALGMKGAAPGEGLNAAVEALKAGADILLCSNTPLDDIKAIVAQVKAGKISEKIINERCRKVLAYKYALGLTKAPKVSLKGLASRLNSPSMRAVNDALACGAVTLIKNGGNMLPLTGLAKKSIAVVNIGAPRDNNFADIASRYTGVDVYSVQHVNFTAPVLQKIKKHDIVIAAVYDDHVASRTAFEQLSKVPGLVGVFFVSPYKLSKFKALLPNCQAIMLGYEDLPELRAAAAMAVFGGIPVSGRLPVDLPGIAPLGTGIKLSKTRLGYSTPLAEGLSPSLTDSLDRIVRGAVAQGAFPGAQLLVARNGNIVYDKAFGHQTKGGAKVTHSTMYDLASVSKATGTLPGIMKLYDLGLVNLDAPISKYIPEATENGKNFTVREMLYHETGMPASISCYDLLVDTTSYTGKLFSRRRDAAHRIRINRNTWANTQAKVRRDIISKAKTKDFPIAAGTGYYVGQATIDTVIATILSRPLRSTKAYNYSCLNFILLMDMEQRITGLGHDRWVGDSIFTPLGMANTAYQPLTTHPLSQIAPTERDPLLRRQLVHGYVHDETAATLGGVSGNAGLFSTAGDLAKLCQMWLNGGTYGGVRVLSEPTVKLFTTAKSPTCRRGLGFDKPDTENPDNSPTCEEAGPGVYGHLGFTGTVFWVDPDKDLIFIFLNNRVNPTRENAAFSRLNVRPELFRQVYKALL